MQGGAKEYCLLERGKIWWSVYFHEVWIGFKLDFLICYAGGPRNIVHKTVEIWWWILLVGVFSKGFDWV